MPVPRRRCPSALATPPRQYVEDESTWMGTGSQVPTLTLDPLLHLSALTSSCLLHVLPLTRRLCNAPAGLSSIHGATAQCILHIAPDPQCSLHSSSAGIRPRARGARYEARVAVRLRVRVAAPSISIHSNPPLHLPSFLVPPSLPHSSCPHLLSSSPSPPSIVRPFPSFPAPSYPAAPCPPTAHPHRSTRCVGVYPSGADMRSVLQVHTEAAFRQARCEAGIAHASGPCARSPLLFAPTLLSSSPPTCSAPLSLLPPHPPLPFLHRSLVLVPVPRCHRRRHLTPPSFTPLLNDEFGKRHGSAEGYSE
jgi:hypothetical protein